MDKKSYYLMKDRKKKEALYFEIDSVDGYQINPKVKGKNQIAVDKIIFVNSDFSEKIIRKKIDKKIAYLLKILEMIEDGSETSPAVIEKTIMQSEKLRVQIINNYVKYLGHTYETLTLEKIKLITDRLKYNYIVLNEKKYYSESKENGRGR